jgi:hypothetical protein
MLGPGQWQVKPASSVFVYDAGERQVHWNVRGELDARLLEEPPTFIGASARFCLAGVVVFFINRCCEVPQP